MSRAVKQLQPLAISHQPSAYTHAEGEQEVKYVFLGSSLNISLPSSLQYPTSGASKS
jgi:hypothetical protein